MAHTILKLIKQMIKQAHTITNSTFIHCSTAFANAHTSSYVLYTPIYKQLQIKT